MLANIRHSRGLLVLFSLLAGGTAATIQSADAQQTSDGGYAIAEPGDAQVSDPVPAAGTQENTGPVRLARFAFVQGNVRWRIDENSEWSAASLNLPLRQGAQITVSDGGRAELQFDDGSLLRLGSGAVLTLQTLYSDRDGEFTELKLTDGLASLHLRTDRSVYQVNTPLGSLKAAGPASLRLGVGNGLEVAVQSGKATLEGPQGKADLERGDFLDLANVDSKYTLRDIPRADSWDRWVQERDNLLSHAAEEPANAHLPADIAIVAQDINDYGTWKNDSEDGWVWCPRVSSPDWRPYHDGQWTWVNPFGWTWVSNEAWGWAPYHYGTWVSRPYGWAWCPGPVHQYWSPAVVHFSEYEGNIGWCPLAPQEVRYPSAISFGFRGRDWSTYFSICGAAVYYPTNYGYCAPRVFDTVYVNRVTYVTNNVTYVSNNGPSSFNRFGLSQEAYAANNNTYLNRGAAFIPRNSRVAAGVTTVSSANFGGRGSYVSVAKADTSLFERGRVIGAPPRGAAPLAGPIGVKPTPQAMTPSRTFTAAPPSAPSFQARPVYRAPIASAVARNSAPITPTGRIATPAQGGYVNPRIGSISSGNLTGNGIRIDRTPQNDRTTTGPVRNSGTTGPNSGRIPVQPQGNNAQNPGTGRINTYPANGTGSLDRRPSFNDPRPSISAAEAAAAARASLGGSKRIGSTGNASDGNGNNERTSPLPRYSGANGTRYPGSIGTGNSGNDRLLQTPRSSGSNGPGSNNGSGSTYDRAPQTPRYDRSSGSNGSSNGSSYGDRGTPTVTPRQPQTAPPRSEPPRNDPPRSVPQYTPPRSEPTRSDPPRSAPQYTSPRSEPSRNEPPRSVPQSAPPRSEPPARQPDRTPPRSEPPARQPDRTPPPTNKDNGTDSKNSGRNGRGS